ncbi:BTAD domain-containing putative transcriptional regulator [Pseudonocardia xinjiangensis]|uniref:BTAD domain-containing putative transcriptional regulator n=1 Tax=Pseudonocardia xinjiangensis TaxID=75289 RepID=UPI003D8F7932
MQVGILGPLEVQVGDARVALGGARLRTLLIRLAVDTGRTVSVNALAEALWPEQKGAGAPAGHTHALHSLVSRLRRALPGEWVRSGPGGYLLDLPPEALDATRFERLARAGRTALQDGHADVAGRRLREALALWRGDALADVADVPFAAAVIARLDELRLSALEDRAQADLLTGAEPAQLVAELRAMTAAHPGRERAQALLLRALQADGRPAEALGRYAELRSALADALGAEPSPQVREAHLAVLRAEEVRRPRSRQGNLRAALTSFVGRQEERALVARRLAGSRLVTLTGPGGAGKTRLATTVAADLADGMRGGAWLVELAAVTDPGEVVQAVLSAFGSQGTGGVTARDTMDRLAGAVPTSPTLLVMDNCEHLLDAAAALCEELLGQCPLLCVLATSREPLGITPEALVPVPPLPLAAPTADAGEILASPAARLFAERAAAAHPGFRLTAANAVVVADICRRLDGLPLAIELAAARTRSVPVEHLATMLDDRFGLLGRGSRTALPRHRTLGAVVGWSWDLLTDDERGLGEALSVFPGTITLAAAERVAPPGVAVQQTLAALVDKSLLHLVPVSGVRYRMLETIREYGMRRLAANGDLDRARAAYTRHFLELAETAAPDLRGPDQLRWIPTLTEDRENLLGALQGAAGAGDADTAIRLASAISFFLTLHGDHAQAARLLRDALALPTSTAPAVHAPAVAAYLINVVLAGTVETGEPALDRFRAAAASGHPSALVIAPLLAALSGDPAPLLTTEPPARAAPFGRAMVRLMRGLLRANRGDLQETCRDLVAAAEEFEALGERWGTAVSLTRFGTTALVLGDVDGALGALRRARVPAAELGNDDHQRVCAATAHIYAGDTVRARAELDAVVAGAPAAHHLALARMLLGDVERRDGDLSAAAREYDAARRAVGRRAETDRPFQVQYRTGLAHLAMARGDTAGALTDLQAAFAEALATDQRALLAGVGTGLAALRAGLGEPAAAAVALGAAHAVRGAADSLHPDVARLTHELRRGLGDRFGGCYDRGRSLGRAAAAALLASELAAAQADPESLTGA